MSDAGFEYLAFGPPDGTVPTALVILLHGYGRNATYMHKMADAVRADVPGAMILSVHGPAAMNHAAMNENNEHHLHVPEEAQTDLPDGLTPGMMREWFRIDGNREALMPRLDAISARLNHFIDVQRDGLGLTDRNVVLLGFSQGGGTALYTAYTRGSELAALICHSSIVVEGSNGDSNLGAHPKTLFLYGADDPEFSQNFYKWSFSWVQKHTGGKALERVIAGMGHYNNAQSRKICAEFVRDALVN